MKENAIALFWYFLQSEEILSGDVRMFDSGSTHKFLSGIFIGDDIISVSNDLSYGTYVFLIDDLKPDAVLSRSPFSVKGLGDHDVEVPADAVVLLKGVTGNRAAAYFYKVCASVREYNVIATLKYKDKSLYF